MQGMVEPWYFGTQTVAFHRHLLSRLYTQLRLGTELSAYTCEHLPAETALDVVRRSLNRAASESSEEVSVNGQNPFLPAADAMSFVRSRRYEPQSIVCECCVHQCSREVEVQTSPDTQRPFQRRFFTVRR